MRYSEVFAPVSREEAETATCPTCGARPGERCVYIADNYSYASESPGYYPRVKRLAHRQGDPLESRAHGERLVKIRVRRREQWHKEQLDRRPVVPASRTAHEAAAALRAFDVAEHHRLVTWWREHGHIIVNADRTRPDGTVRGRSYAAIGDECAIDACFAAQEEGQ